jgi:hypothetical protein
MEVNVKQVVEKLAHLVLLLMTLFVILFLLFPISIFQGEPRVSIEVVQDGKYQFSQISIAGTPVIRLESSQSSKAQGIANRLKRSLRFLSDPHTIRATPIDGTPAVLLDQSIIVLVDDASARLNTSSKQMLAIEWADNIRLALESYRANGIWGYIRPIHSYLLQIPVFTALVALTGVALLGPYINHLYGERQLLNQGRRDRFARQQLITSTLAERLDRLLAMHNLEHSFRRAQAALEGKTLTSFAAQEQYSAVTTAWVRTLEAIAVARGDYSAVASEVDLYFGAAAKRENENLRTLYNGKGESFEIAPTSDLFEGAQRLLTELSKEIQRTFVGRLPA